MVVSSMGTKTVVEIERREKRGSNSNSKERGKPNTNSSKTNNSNKRSQANRPDWIYINVRRKHAAELQRIVDREGEQLNINDWKELLRQVVIQLGIKYRESANFADAVEHTFIDMFPTIRHYDELQGIITRNFMEYVNWLKQEQERKERELEKNR
jgi:hypothetical protein